MGIMLEPRLVESQINHTHLQEHSNNGLVVEMVQQMPVSYKVCKARKLNGNSSSLIPNSLQLDAISRLRAINKVGNRSSNSIFPVQ